MENLMVGGGIFGQAEINIKDSSYRALDKVKVN